MLIQASFPQLERCNGVKKGLSSLTSLGLNQRQSFRRGEPFFLPAIGIYDRLMDSMASE